MDVVSWAEKSMWNSVANRSVELFVSVGRGCVIMRSTLKINFYSVRDGKSWNANTKSTRSENCHQSWRDSHSRGGRGKYVVVATLFFTAPGKTKDKTVILLVFTLCMHFISTVIILLKSLQLGPWKDDSENENLLCLKRNLKCPFSWLIIGRIANWDFYFTLFVSAGLTLCCINQRSARLDKVWENCPFYWRNI